MDISIKLNHYGDLDEFALLACQQFNLGNDSGWFGAFRGGLNGFYARVYGFVQNYHQVHAWLPRIRLPHEIEYHLATAFFQMDSSIECLTFAFNALGFGCLPDEFRNITTEKGLRQINPRDISGPMPDDKETRAAPTGYMTIFPSLQKFWRGSTKLIQEVTDQHDVSKHRESIFTGGRARTDAPPSFFENLGVPDDAAARAMFWPMKEIILRRFPRRPQELRKGLEKEPRVVFENLTEQCINFIEETGRIALNDAKRNITLQQDYL